MGGILKNITSNKDTKLKFYEVMAPSALLCGCESSETTQRQKSKIQVAEMKFLRKLKGCNWLDKHRNKDIRKDLQVFSLNNRILEYKHNGSNTYKEWLKTDSLKKRKEQLRTSVERME
jgi:hypothetical protein